MKLKDGDMFYTEQGLYRIEKGSPVFVPKEPGQFGGHIKSAKDVKHEQDLQVIIAGRISRLQPKNHKTNINVKKRGSNSDFQTVSLEANTIVEVLDTRIKNDQV